jgi:hypothetical protein
MPLVLFLDNSTVSQIDERLTKRMHRPVRSGLVLRATEPWESYMVYAYNQVVYVGPGDYRLYYDCIEGDFTKNPPVQVARRICLALSADGITWRKPNLGVYPLPSQGGSTANNIVLFAGSGVSVFKDNAPGVPENQRWKLICSMTDAQDDWNQTVSQVLHLLQSMMITLRIARVDSATLAQRETLSIIAAVDSVCTVPQRLLTDR